MSKKLTFATTGPSVYSDEILNLIEDYFKGRQLYISSNNKEDIIHWLEQSDAYIGAGGTDLGVNLYDSEITNGDCLNRFDPMRDEREKLIIKYCLDNNKPMLLICRTHQLIGSVFYNIPLIKNVNDCEVVHSPHSSKIDVEGLPGVHFLYLFKEHQKEFEAEKYFVGSSHHQALYMDNQSVNYCKSVGLELLGYAHLNYNSNKLKEQKIIEFMRGIDKPFYSVQFHVESGYQTNKLYQIILEKFKKLLP